MVNNFCYKIRTLLCMGLFAFSNCDSMQVPKVDSPAGYDFSKGKKFFLPGKLEEISGIAFVPGSDSMLMAVNDEEGRIYPININNPKSKIPHFKFGKNGDYEDIAFFAGKWRVLQSNGAIHSADIENNIIDRVWSILPEGEYEGMAAHNDVLYIACKDCPKTKKGKAPVHLIKHIDDSLYVDATLQIDADSFIERKNKKILISALSKHPFTREWYILSHLNAALYIADENLKVKQSIKLHRSQFLQPEGIAFSSTGDLIISNEGDGSSGSIIIFKYMAPSP